MAAQYTEVTLEDMEKFLKRGFRALRPKQGVQHNEYYYDLFLSPNVSIRVWTSVQRNTGSGAGVGEDAIRVQLMNVPGRRPLLKGKAPIVKRTQGWRNTLQTKIEDCIETYEEKLEYFEGRANQTPQTPQAPTSSPPPPADTPSPSVPTAPTPRPPGGGPTDKQVNFVKKLMTRANPDRLEASGIFERFRGLEWPFSEANIRSMPLRQVSQLIDALMTAVGWQRYADSEADYDYRDTN